MGCRCDRAGRLPAGGQDTGRHRPGVAPPAGRADPPGTDRSPEHLSGAIEWSVGLVTPEAAALLSRLGVMAGWFSADDAAAVAPETRDRIGALLTELAAQSLVVTDTSGSTTRYRLLETIRQFAVEGLGEEMTTVQAAHVAHFAGVAEREGQRLRGSAEAAAVDELAPSPRQPASRHGLERGQRRGRRRCSHRWLVGRLGILPGPLRAGRVVGAERCPRGSGASQVVRAAGAAAREPGC